MPSGRVRAPGLAFERKRDEELKVKGVREKLKEVSVLDHARRSGAGYALPGCPESSW